MSEDSSQTETCSYTEIINCVHQYITTDETFVVEDIVGVFDRIETRWMMVKFEGYDEMEYEGEHLLRRDDCHTTIRSFWTKADCHRIL